MTMTLSVTFGDSSPIGRAKAARIKVTYPKKRSVSIQTRSVNCFTNTRQKTPVKCSRRGRVVFFRTRPNVRKAEKQRQPGWPPL